VKLRNLLNRESILSRRSGPSDGLYTDLDHAKNASQVGAEIIRRVKTALTVCFPHPAHDQSADKIQGDVNPGIVPVFLNETQPPHLPEEVLSKALFLSTCL